jgi:hypothetical protein
MKEANRVSVRTSWGEVELAVTFPAGRTLSRADRARIAGILDDLLGGELISAIPTVDLVPVARRSR